MNSVRFHQTGSSSVLKLEMLPDPIPGSGQVLIDVKFAGVNPYEVYMREGKYPLPALPVTLGHDTAGVVESVGKGITRFKTGDRVYSARTISGAYSNKALCDEKMVFPLPANVSFEQGAAIGVPYATAWRALHHRAKVQAGQTVLIHGASGGVGTAGVQTAKAAGLTVIGTAGSTAGMQLAREQGADHIFDHSQPGYEHKMMELTRGKGFDVILEMLANVNLPKDLSMIAKFGSIVVIGSRGPVEIDPRQAMGKDANVLGMSLWNASVEELIEIHEGVVAGLASGELRPVIGKIFPLTEAGAAQDFIMTAGARGKVLLSCAD